MDTLDFSYRATVSLAGAGARAVVRGLPEGWRMRLQADLPDLQAGRWVWLHAVSVGELLLAEGLVGRLREAGHPVHVSTGTPAGFTLLTRRREGWDGGTGQITAGAFPLDDPAGLEPFLRRPPGAFLTLETELWPGLLEALQSRGIPRLVVNGRLTGKSLRRGGPWLRRAASRLTLVAARDPASLAAFRELGAPAVALGGNLKADLPAPRPLHAGWALLQAGWAGQPVLVAGNTLEGEEELVLEAWRAARSSRPGVRLILAPRQPQRFEAVARLLAGQGLRCLRASGAWPVDAAAWKATEVLLLDTLGELPAAYAEGTLAVVAGGWAASGGHNPLEAIRAGIPTLIGPGFCNFEDLVQPLRSAGHLDILPADGIGAWIEGALAAAPLRSAGTVTLPESLTGALARTWSLIAPHLPTR